MSSLIVVEVSESVADGEEAANAEGEGEEAVAGDNLDEREHVRAALAPVARIEERLVELGSVDMKHPVVSEGEPDDEEDAENVVGYSTRVGRLQIFSVLIRVLLQLLQLPLLHLAPQHRHDLEEAEAPSHQKVDGNVGFLGTILQMLHAWKPQNKTWRHLTSESIQNFFHSPIEIIANGTNMQATRMIVMTTATTNNKQSA